MSQTQNPDWMRQQERSNLAILRLMVWISLTFGRSIGRVVLHGIAALRRSALELLQMLEIFNPYLTGSVLDGTAGEHSHIDILLFADSAKEVEIFLLNRGIDVAHGDSRSDKVEAVLRIATDVADANLIVMAQGMERVAMKHRDGRPRARIRAPALAALLEE